MRVVVTAIGTNHYFHLASELDRRGMLEAIFTGYPRFKLRDRAVDQKRIRTFPWFQTLYMSQGRLGIHSEGFSRQLCHVSNRSLDSYVSKMLPRCDVFIGQSNCCLKTGQRAQSRGATFICDRPCAHVRYQDTLLREEYARQKLGYSGIDPRIIDREEKEYELADLILVGSTFAKRSFLEMGMREDKLRLVPYGADTSRFYATGSERNETFTVLFAGSASIQKGVPDLLAAFSMLRCTNKRLIFVGAVSAEVSTQIEQTSGVEVLGPRPQQELRDLMNSCHVLVLPSIQEGFGMVLAEALACGLPVIASTNTGGPDLFDDATCGFIVPPKCPELIADRLQELSDNSSLWAKMSQAAIERSSQLGGWNTYGDRVVGICEAAVDKS